MLSYLLIKPGATHLLPQLSDSLAEMHIEAKDDASKKCIDLVREGIRVLRGEESKIGINTRLLYVGTGVVSDELFEKLYPSPPVNEGGERLRKTMLNQPYGIIIIDTECSVRDVLSAIKGKFLTEDPNERLGLRGLMKEKYKIIGHEMQIHEEEKKPGLGENFIHTPDTEQEVRELYSYMVSLGNGEEKMELYNSGIHLRQGNLEKNL